MIIKWFKRVIAGIKMLFITETSTIKENNDTTNTISGGIVPQDTLGDGIQQEAKWFTRENNLVAEFYGEPPIVYEADMITIVKEHQYGYIPKPGEIVMREPEELFADDVDLVPNIDRLKPKTNTVDYAEAYNNFESRWAEIKRKVREEDIDGLIKDSDMNVVIKKSESENNNTNS